MKYTTKVLALCLITILSTSGLAEAANQYEQEFETLDYGLFAGPGVSALFAEKQNGRSKYLFSYSVAPYGGYNFSHLLGVVVPIEYNRTGAKLNVIDMTNAVINIVQHNIQFLPRVRFYFGASRSFFLSVGLGARLALKQSNVIVDSSKEPAEKTKKDKKDHLLKNFNLVAHVSPVGFEFSNGLFLKAYVETAILDSRAKKAKNGFDRITSANLTAAVGWNIAKLL